MRNTMSSWACLHGHPIQKYVEARKLHMHNQSLMVVGWDFRRLTKTSLKRNSTSSVETNLQVAEQKCSGLPQGLVTMTVRVAVPTLPTLSAAVYVTV